MRKLVTEPTRNGEYHFYVWDLPPHAHTCTAYARWKEQDEARQAQERHQILHSPFPPDRMHSIRQRTGIPKFVCGGVGDEGNTLPWLLCDVHISYPNAVMNAAREVRRWATTRSGKARKGFWVHGGSGVGKTTLLGSVGADIAFRSPVLKVTYWNFDTLMQAHYANVSRKTHDVPRILDLTTMLDSTDVMILDDIGTIGSTAAPAEMLMRIAEAYYSGENVPATAVLLMASNESPAELAQKLNRMKPEHPEYGDRVIRRLIQQTGAAIKV